MEERLVKGILRDVGEKHKGLSRNHLVIELGF